MASLFVQRCVTAVNLSQYFAIPTFIAVCLDDRPANNETTVVHHSYIKISLDACIAHRLDCCDVGAFLRCQLPELAMLILQSWDSATLKIKLWLSRGDQVSLRFLL